MRGAVESSRYAKGESCKVSVKSVADGNFQGELNSVISSFNRNFTGYIVLSSSSFYADLCSRHDGNPGTHSFVTSPELATVFAYHGALDCDPTTDSIRQADGNLFKFTPPKSDELPASFSTGNIFTKLHFQLIRPKTSRSGLIPRATVCKSLNHSRLGEKVTPLICPY